VFYIAGNIDCMNRFFKKRFIAQIVCARIVCTSINYEFVPVTNLNKYLHYGTSVTIIYIYICIYIYAYKYSCK